MKNVLLLLMALIVSIFAGCDNSNKPQPKPVVQNIVPSPIPTRDPEAEIRATISTYFPVQVGMRWVYKVETFPGIGVLTHHDYRLPSDDGHRRMIEMRGWLFGAQEIPRNGELIVKVDSISKEEGVAHYYNEEYIIKIEKDDLQIYKDAKALFWGINTIGMNKLPNYTVEEVFLSSYFGLSKRYLLTSEKPGIALDIRGGNERLLCLKPTVLDNIPCVHFIRQVLVAPHQSEEDKSSFLTYPYTEDLWYGKDIGLIRLEQKFGEHLTMVWNLVGKPSL